VSGPAPDLVVTNLDTRFVTVRNQGATAAGPFTVTVAGFGAARVAGGLPPGASATVQFYAGAACGGDYRAVADSAQEVSESVETNNGKELLGVVC
jgi:subtilase family serine protease